MKEWPADHPKAKLMARKRAAILDAARDAFLSQGYEGASMEGIAAKANVSIMTLYRHARGKDNLFAAVVSSVCHPADEAEQARIDESLQKSLQDILIFVGMMFQDRLASPTTVALCRAVMVETARHPQLATMVYHGLISAHEDALDAFLGQRPEAALTDPVLRRRLSTTFLDQLVGTDILRVLLGLGGTPEEERLGRAERAAAELLRELRRSDKVAAQKG